MRIGRRKGKKWGDRGEHEQVFLTRQQLLKQRQAGRQAFTSSGKKGLGRRCACHSPWRTEEELDPG